MRPARLLSAVVLFLVLSRVEAVELQLHPEDHRTCSTCRAALDRSLGYLRKNFDAQVANDGWYAGMLNSFYGGFAFMMEGNSAKEAKVCSQRMGWYLENWAKKGGGFDGWFASMAMLSLSEYSLRYGATPEIRAQLEFGAKFCHKTREAEGGWFHSPRWGGPNYALDISAIGCGYFAAMDIMDALGMSTGPALADVRDYVDHVCDGRSVAYGLHGRGGFSLASASYLVIGLTSSGHGDDPRVKAIGDNLLNNVEKIRNAHASGMLHHFGVAAALHRSGPEAYSRFAGHYLHRYFIANQAADGSLAPFPNDNTAAPEVAYAELKKGGDYAATAILTSMLLMTRQGAFSPFPPRKAGAPPNKQCFAKAQELLAAGSLGQAHALLSQVLPGGGDDVLIPRAQKQRRALEELLAARLNAWRELVSPETIDPADRDAAAPVGVAVLTAIEQAAALEKIATGLPAAGEAKALGIDLRKRLGRLRGKFGPTLGRPAEGAPPVKEGALIGDPELADGITRVLAFAQEKDA